MTESKLAAANTAVDASRNDVQRLKASVLKLFEMKKETTEACDAAIISLEASIKALEEAGLTDAANVSRESLKDAREIRELI